MMKSCMRTLLALLLALALLATGIALAEAELEIGEIVQDAAIEAVEAPEALPELALDDGALAIEDVEPDAVEAEANASGEVKINKANFPAEDFRKYVKAHFDTDGNGSLSEAEIEDAREIAGELRLIARGTSVGFYRKLGFTDLAGDDVHTLGAELGEEILVDALQGKIQVGMNAQVIPGGIILG